jgi:hypothetical protein
MKKPSPSATRATQPARPSCTGVCAPCAGFNNRMSRVQSVAHGRVLAPRAAGLPLHTARVTPGCIQQAHRRLLAAGDGLMYKSSNIMKARMWHIDLRRRNQDVKQVNDWASLSLHAIWLPTHFLPPQSNAVAPSKQRHPKGTCPSIIVNWHDSPGVEAVFQFCRSFRYKCVRRHCGYEEKVTSSTKSH